MSLDDVRQPKPVSIVVDSASAIDRDNMVHMLYRFLAPKFDNINSYPSGESTIIRCYPRAVND